MKKRLLLPGSRLLSYMLCFIYDEGKDRGTGLFVLKGMISTECRCSGIYSDAVRKEKSFPLPEKARGMVVPAGKGEVCPASSFFIYLFFKSLTDLPILPHSKNTRIKDNFHGTSSLSS